MDEFQLAILQWHKDVLARLDKVIDLLEYQHSVTEQLMADRAERMKVEVRHGH